jgi:hypothetical protein
MGDAAARAVIMERAKNFMVKVGFERRKCKLKW